MEAPLQGRFPTSFQVRSATTADQNLINYALVNAFTNVPFKGNPAGVCILPAWRETYWLQQVASELNVNMMAFLVKREDKPDCNGAVEGVLSSENKNHLTSTHAFNIRWFTPLTEVTLCGHATLASSYLLFGSGVVDGDMIQFHPENGGALCARRIEKATRDGFLVELDFPILPTSLCDFDNMPLSKTFQDLKVISCHRTSANDLLVELLSGEDVEALVPCMDEIKRGKFRGLIVTGKALNPSLGCDFVSRFFAPKVGIDEDPVCGQAHCALAPFWGKRLNKSSLVAYQASKRGGTLRLRVDFEANRVFLQGEATLVMAGILLL